MTKPRLVVADDHEDFLREVTVLLEAEFDVLGVARDGTALLELAACLRPDVVVTDFRMAGISGLEAGSILLERGLCKAVVLVTMYADRQLMAGALQAGIRGFVLKVSAAEDLIPAIHHAFRGETYQSSLGMDPV